MDLTRIGANRKEVVGSAFVGRQPRVSIDSKTGSIDLVIQYADGMGTQGQYDYTVSLSPRDLSVMLEAISKARAAFEPGELQQALEASAASLLRLVAAASAPPFALAPTEWQLKLQAAKERQAAKATPGDA